MRLLIAGAGGHARVACETAIAMRRYDEVCFSCNIEHSPVMLGRNVLDESKALELGSDYWDEVFVAVGDSKGRRSLTNKFTERGFAVATLIHPMAVVSPSAHIGNGTLIAPGAIVNACAVIGECCIVNTGAIVEHDCSLGSYVHLSPHVSLGGGCSIGDGSWLGIGSCAVDHVSIGNDIVVGAGACVVSDILDAGTYVGIPARRLHG